VPSQRFWRAVETYAEVMARTEATLRRSHDVLAAAEEVVRRAHRAVQDARTVSESRREDSDQETLTDDDWLTCFTDDAERDIVA
jgi:predicted Zn-dependent protease